MTLKIVAVLVLFAAAGVLAQLEDSVGNPCSFKGACLNGARCTAPLDVPICQCASGFGGDRCQNKVPVKIGRCKPDPLPGVFNCTRGCDSDSDCPGMLKCCNTDCERQCTDQFVIDPCQNYNCLNGGTCTAPADAPSCICPNGYTGDKCESSTGVCPIFKSLTTTVCGIVPCKRNGQCGPNEKCCVLPCGGKFCVTAVFPQTTPPPTPPPTLPCYLADCLPGGFICRNVVTCPNCQLQAKCIPQTDFSKIDKACKSRGYTEAILLQSSSYNNSYSQLLCRGPGSMTTKKCPAGSFCVDVGKRRSQCCAGKITPVPRY